MNGIDLMNITMIPVGFFVVMITMACISIGLILFFIKKRWILVGGKNAGQEQTHGIGHQ